MRDTNGWSRAELHVMKELERLSAEIRRLGGQIDCVDRKLSNLRVEVAQKGAVWGAVTGTIVAFVGWALRR